MSGEGLRATLLSHSHAGGSGARPHASDVRKGLTSQEAAQLLEDWGPNEIPVVPTPMWKMVLKQFTGTMPMMLEVSCLVSAVAQDLPDFAVIAAMLIVNAALGFREEMKAKHALDELTNSLESTVTCLRDGAPQVLGVTRLVPGDVIHLRSGTMTPADVEWLKGDTLSIDTAALTGEPIPRKYPSPEHGSLVLSGCTVKQGEAYCIVCKTGIHTEIGQGQADIAADRASASVSVFEERVMTVVNIIIFVAVIDAICLVLVQGLVRDGFRSTERKSTLLIALSILIAAIPIALPLVMQVTMAIGAYRMATQHHAIVTRMSALQDIASMDVLCSDKTGTLTTAKMSINLDLIWPASDDVHSILGLSSMGSQPPNIPLDMNQVQVLLMAVLSSNEDKRDDAIDGGVLRAFDTMNAERGGELMRIKAKYKQLKLTGFNPEVKRTIAHVRRPDGVKLVVAKGLVSKILDTSAGGLDESAFQWRCVECDEDSQSYRQRATGLSFTEMVMAKDVELSSAGYKTLAVAVGLEGEEMHFLGLLPMIDPPRSDTALTIHRLLDAGVEVKMITGDHLNIAKETARLVGLGTNILPGEMTRSGSYTRDELVREADGFAQVLPRDKRECVLVLQKAHDLVVGMTGDGVNDAPALSAAQCGIAVDDATDAAKNAAAMILTTEGLSAVFGAVVESRKIFARLFSYVSYRLAATVQILLFLSILVYVFDCSLNPLYVILLALFNDITMLPIAEDRQTASAAPEHAHISKLIGFSVALGVTESILSMGYYLCMDLGLVKGLADHGELGFPKSVHAQNAIWLQVSISAEFLIYSARAPGLFFCSRPSTELIFTTMMGNVVSSLLAIYAFPESLDWEEVAIIWVFDIVGLFVVDFVKLIYKYAFEHAIAGVIDESKISKEDEAVMKGDIEAQALVRKDRKKTRASFMFLATGAKPRQSQVFLRQESINSLGTSRASVRRVSMGQLPTLHKRTPGTVARSKSMTGGA